MCAMATKVEYTPEDLLAMPNEKKYELVDGELVERNIGALSSWIGGELVFRLRSFLQDHPVGYVWPADNGFQCFPNSPNKVRRPDVSFVRTGRLPNDEAPEGWVRIVPDLVVEVLSRRDLALQVEKRLHDFRSAGVALIWMINPNLRTIRVHRKDGRLEDLEETEEISGEDVIPGFRCRVGDLFPPREKVPQAPA